MKYTDEEILAVAVQCTSRNDIHTKFARYYHAAARRGLVDKLYALLPIAVGHVTAYSDEELMQHAKQFKTRKEWEAAGNEEVKQGLPSHHRVAFKRGMDFYRKCCAHMPDERGGFRGYRYTDDELLASARRFQTRGEWKKKAHRHCENARLRPIWDECVAHMRPAANPFAKDYIIYAYEFSDNRCYVGLTFIPEERKSGHACRGPVFEHGAKTGLIPNYNVLESGLDYKEAGTAEDRWQADYKARGWTALHTAKAGSLGGIHTKWTKEAVLVEAKKYLTRQAWIDGCQVSYRVARKHGWVEEAAAHMPKRVLGIGVGRVVSAATRRKQRAAKLGKTLTRAHRAAISVSVTEQWKNRSVAYP